MYLFGHIGITVAVAHSVDRDVDLRWAALLASAPDLLDKPVALLFPTLVNDNTRGFGHTLLGAVVVLAALSVLLKGNGRIWLLWGCYLGHFLLDRMWLENNPIVLFWPMLGPLPPPQPDRLILLLWNVAGESIGLGLLLGLARRHRLFERAKFGAFLKTGRLS